jgi:hypothetical protein
MPTATRPRAGRATLDIDRRAQTPADRDPQAQALEDLITGIRHRAVLIEHAQESDCHSRALPAAISAAALDIQAACDQLTALVGLWLPPRWPAPADDRDAGSE